MFIKITKSGPRSYVQLVEAYRDDDGRPKQRTITTLGRLDKLDSGLESIISGLLRVTGKSLPEVAAPLAVNFEATRTYGDVWALTELWNALGFGDLAKIFRRTRHEIDIESLIRIMALNRLCDPESKLGVLRWLETVALPGVAMETVEHQHLLRAMDAMVEHQDEVDKVLVSLLRPLVDQDLAMVFYDMTTIRAEGLTTQEGDVRQYGMSKEGIIARQFMLGVVQTAEGLPLYHEVFDGNTGEVSTLMPVIQKIIQRFPVKRIIVVADRGLLSVDNIAELEAIALPDGTQLEFILAVPGRRYTGFADLLKSFHTDHCSSAKEEVLGEVVWNGHRLIIAHDPAVSATAGAKRDSIIAELEAKALQWAGKLEAQEAGKKARGRKASDGGVRALFYRAVTEAHLSKIILVDLKSDLFTYSIDEKALALARIMDGKLLLVTNVADLTPANVIKRYKSLADIERGFRVLKSEIEIGPVHHRLPNRIRAHATICFIALILYRVMRARLRTANAKLSPGTALAALSRIQRHRVTINDSQPVVGLSSIDQNQSDILRALAINAPTLKTQLTLL
jgi:transposase